MGTDINRLQPSGCRTGKEYNRYLKKKQGTSAFKSRSQPL